MRRRSSDGRIEHRLGRTVDETSSAPDVTILNISSTEYHARQFIRIIKGERYDREWPERARRTMW
jgi:ribose 1,5-bisphosphokinase